MDPRLAGQYSVKGAKEIAHLALQCISLHPKDRPRMAMIVETLESLEQFKDMAVTSGQFIIASTMRIHRLVSFCSHRGCIYFYLYRRIQLKSRNIIDITITLEFEHKE